MSAVPPAHRARWPRWALFSASILSLMLMTYAGVLLAFSVPLTSEMLRLNPDAPEATRVVVVPITDPRVVRTHAEHDEGAYLVSGELDGSFPASAHGTSMARALAYVPPPVDGVYEPANLTLTGVPSAHGASDLSVDVAALAAGRSGWIVMGAAEETPRFLAREDVVGEVARFASSSGLGLAFGAAFVGFVGPLIVLIVTHKPTGRRGPPVTIGCLECGAPLPTTADFCLRCGAYRAK